MPPRRVSGLLRRFAPRNDGGESCATHATGLRVPGLVREHAGMDADLAQGASVLLVDVVAEDQVRIGIAMQPSIALDLGLELARRPAGIAEREDGVLRPGAVG